MRGSLSGTLATMGPGVPYLIGAKFAHSDRPGIALVGDGAMQMNGLAELIAIAKYWGQWEDPRLVVTVSTTRTSIRSPGRCGRCRGLHSSCPRRPSDVDYGGFARSLGLGGLRVDKPQVVQVSWEAALTAERPYVLDFRTAPAVPPIPPHTSLDQIEAAAKDDDA